MKSCKRKRKCIFLNFFFQDLALTISYLIKSANPKMSVKMLKYTPTAPTAQSSLLHSTFEPTTVSFSQTK